MSAKEPELQKYNIQSVITHLEAAKSYCELAYQGPYRVNTVLAIDPRDIQDLIEDAKAHLTQLKEAIK